MTQLLGAQRPRFWTAPDRHRDENPDCRYCANDKNGRRGVGCGDYISREMLTWAAGYGYVLDEWQQWIIREGCGVKPGGKWASFENTVIVSRQNGKGGFLEVRELAGLFVLNEELIVHTAHELKTAQEHFLRIVNFLDNNPALMKRVQGGKPRKANGQEEIKLTATPTYIFGSDRKMVRKSVEPRLKFLARTRGSIRGFSANCLVWDEAMILTAEAVGAALPALSAKGNPQMWLTGSAGLEDSEQLAASRRRIVRDDKTLFGAEWSANIHNALCPRDRERGRESNDYVVDCTEHSDRDLPETAAQANPAFGIRIFWDQTLNEMNSMPTVEYDRERLGVGQWPGEFESWKVVPEDLWKARGVQITRGSVTAGRTLCAFALDVAEDGTSASIAVAWIHPDSGNIVMEVPKGCTRPGTEWVIPKLKELAAKYKPLAIVAPKDGPAAGLGDDLEKIWPKSSKWGSKLIRSTPSDHAAAYAWFVQQVKAGTLVHKGKKRAAGLWHAVGSAETRTSGDGGKTWSRKDSTQDITPATSCNLAAWGLNKKRRTYNPLDSIG